MTPKCPDCRLCLDLVYFGPKRFWHCFLCHKWYDGILPTLYPVPEDEVEKYSIQYAIKPDELNSDK